MEKTLFSCNADGRIISLDLRLGRYFARRDGSTSADREAGSAPVVASIDLEWVPPVLPNWRDHLLALAAILLGRVAVTILPFRRLLRLAPSRSPSDIPDPARLTDLVVRYRTTRRRLPLTPRCLPDSVALRQFLMWHRQRSDIVIGVRGHPFSAHCWVQAGDLLLSDRVSNIDRLSPICSTQCLASS